MFLGKVTGSIVSTAKHPDYENQKLMVVRLETPDRKATETTMIAIDTVGAGVGDWVLVASEGLAASELLASGRLIPVREVVVGIVDRVDRRPA